MSWNPPHVEEGDLVLFCGKNREENAPCLTMAISRANPPVFAGTVLNGGTISYYSACRFPDDPFFNEQTNRNAFNSEWNTESGVIRIHPWKLEIERLKAQLARLEEKLARPATSKRGRPEPAEV